MKRRIGPGDGSAGGAGGRGAVLLSTATAVLLLVLAACDPAPGTPCTQDSACGGGLMCARPIVDGGPAPNGVCSPNLTEAGGRCAVNQECARGLFCSNDLPAAVKQRYGICIARQSQGAPCFRDLNCASGLVCAKGTGADTGLCAPEPPAPDAAAPDADPTDAPDQPPDGGPADTAQI